MINIESLFPINKINESKEIINFLSINYIGTNSSIDEINTYTGDLPENVTLFSRLDFIERNDNLGKIKSEIHKNRPKYHIVCIEPTSPKLASFAVSDGRVDMIRIGSSSSIKIFNSRYANRVEEEDKLLEIDLSTMFVGNNSNYRQLLRIIGVLKNTSVKFILTRKAQAKNELITYRGLQAVGRVLGLSNKQTDGTILIEKIEKNKSKIDGSLIFSGAEFKW